jgi:ComEC/Rec2-related protein
VFSFFIQRQYCQLFAALATGIALGNRWPLPGELLREDWWLYWLIVGCLALVWWQLHDNPAGRVLLLPFAIVVLLGHASASLALHLAQSQELEQHVSRKPQELRGRVASVPRLRGGHLRFLLDVKEVDGTPTSGKCFAYLKNDEPPELYFSDEIELWASLDEVQAPLNRGEFDYRAYLMRRGTVLTAYAASPRCLHRISRGRPWPFAQVEALRRLLTGNIRRAVPAPLCELCVSIVFGDRVTEISEDTMQRFREAGLTHILVASGTQVSLVVALISLFFWRFTFEFNWRGVLKSLLQFSVTMGVVLVYSSITGFETSIVRALAMGALVLGGKLMHRDADGLSVLAQSGMILLTINPLELFSAGFQLSFGATFGLIYMIGVVHPLYSGAVRSVKWAGGTLASTGGAQLFVAPLLASAFHQLSVWGLISNLLAIPLAFALLVGGALLSAGLGEIPLLGWLLSRVSALMCWLMDTWASWFAALPGSDIAVPHQSLWWTVVCYGLIFLLAEWFKHRESLADRTRRWLFTAACALGAVLLWPVLAWLLIPRPGLSVLALDGSQAYIWRPYTGRVVVIAASQRFNVRHNDDLLLDALRWRGINRIHAWYWIGEDLDPGRSYASLRIEQRALAGSAVADGLDLAWLGTGGQPDGVVFGLGNATILLNLAGSSAGLNPPMAGRRWIVDGPLRTVQPPSGTARQAQQGREVISTEFEITPRRLYRFR